MSHSSQQRGFSLVELSIVLVILGLLTGGILTGQSLIKAAELRAITTEYTNFQTAVNTFQGKYFAMAGDMGNATEFWGQRADCDALSNDDVTCDGNSNGEIDENENVDGGGQLSGEAFLFWDHLALAGMVEGDYTGHSASATTADAQPGINVPTSRYSGGCYHIEDDPNGSGQRFNRNHGDHYMEFGEDNGTGDCDGALLPPEDVWNVDKKMDDGAPGRGNIVALIWDDCTQAADNNDLDADYLLTETGNVCAMIFTDTP